MKQNYSLEIGPFYRQTVFIKNMEQKIDLKIKLYQYLLEEINRYNRKNV